MAESIVSLAFSVSGVFTLIEQCLALYRRIDDAQAFGENVWQQYVLFQHEYTRFEAWRKEMRDFHLQARGQSSPLPQGRLHPGSETPNADDLMHNTLAQILSTLESVQKL
ncbi:Fc.00g043660.m01.CDS01 [Cosmosporella sp. VM-42]